MPRPTPIVIPGTGGLGGQMNRSVSEVHILDSIAKIAALYDATVGQSKRNAANAEAVKSLAGLFPGTFQGQPRTEEELVGQGQGVFPAGSTKQPLVNINSLAQSQLGQEIMKTMTTKKLAPEPRDYTQTIKRPGPDKKPHYYSWNPDTNKYDIDQGEAIDTPLITKTTPGVSDVSGMRKEFEGSQIYKDYVLVKPQSQKIQEAYKMIGKNNVAVDQTIITVLNKMLDPTSVVRESEYARTPENLSLLNRAVGIIQKQGKGGAGLTDDDRKAILDMASKFGEITESYYKEHEKNYRGIADYYGIPQKLIITTPTFKFKELQPSSDDMGQFWNR